MGKKKKQPTMLDHKKYNMYLRIMMYVQSPLFFPLS